MFPPDELERNVGCEGDDGADHLGADRVWMVGAEGIGAVAWRVGRGADCQRCAGACVPPHVVAAGAPPFTLAGALPFQAPPLFVAFPPAFHVRVARGACGPAFGVSAGAGAIAGALRGAYVDPAPVRVVAPAPG